MEFRKKQLVAFALTKLYNVNVKGTNMNKLEILKLIDDNNGYLTSQLIKKHNIETVYITRLVKENKLFKLARGIYISSKGIEDFLYINSLLHSNLIYSGDTALFLNGLSNKQVPEYEAMVKYGMFVPTIDNMKIYCTRKNTYSLGIIEIETMFGNKVKCYDKERCICDLFLRPDHYDYEDRTYAINEYNNYYLNIKKLYEYASKLGVYNEVKNVYEVIKWNKKGQRI